MKTKSVIILLLIIMTATISRAQHISVRLSFPVGTRLGAPGPAPFRGAVWIGPEWEWRGGRYVTVPGYWGRPSRFGASWVPGHWKYTRRGYRWIPGHWR